MISGDSMIYLVSDIHGYLDKFKQLLEKIKFSDEDTLYILGDIVDRGPQVIDLIRFVMSKKNIKMILGNHEDMMLAYYETKASYDKALWYSNGGDVTDKEFKLLSSDEQKEILKYFSGLPVEYDLEINNKKYNLVHGCYVSKEKKEYYTPSQYQYILIWERVSRRDLGPTNYTVVFGHTCTKHYKDTGGKYSIWKQGNLIGIDCGMAYMSHYPNKVQLACLCLNDLTEYYV